MVWDISIGELRRAILDKLDTPGEPVYPLPLPIRPSRYVPEIPSLELPAAAVVAAMYFLRGTRHRTGSLRNFKFMADRVVKRGDTGAMTETERAVSAADIHRLFHTWPEKKEDYIRN